MPAVSFADSTPLPCSYFAVTTMEPNMSEHGFRVSRNESCIRRACRRGVAYDIIAQPSSLLCRKAPHEAPCAVDGHDTTRATVTRHRVVNDLEEDKVSLFLHIYNSSFWIHFIFIFRSSLYVLCTDYPQVNHLGDV